MTDELQRFRLDGKVALIAGGSGGIGQRLCGAFAGVGARVAIVGRSPEGLETARRLVEDAGSEALVLPGDMTKEAEADRVVAETVARFGRLDILVNGIGGGIGKVMNPAEHFREEDWDWQMDINLKTQFLVSKAAARAMIAAGNGGRILNISSVRGNLGIHLGYTPYVAAKAAMNGLTRQHATEWAKHGITVNAISPTFVATEQARVLLENREFYDSLVARIPLGRIAETDDMVGPALFLCSDASAFVSGQVLLCDGGLTACQ